MTIYEVLARGQVMLAVHERYSFLVSWDRNRTMYLWQETDGIYKLLETSVFRKGLSNVDDAFAAATKLILNVEDKARTTLNHAQILVLEKRNRF